MAYRRIHVIEIKEILLRIARGQSKRKIRKDMHMHADTINKYISISRSLGVDPLNAGELLITDELCIKVKQKISNACSETKVSPRDTVLLPVKDKIEGAHSVLFTRADKMFEALKLSVLDGSHDKTLRYYLKYDLLVIDGFAIRTFSRDEANDLYEIIIERHETKSSIFTSARAPEEWQSLFPDPILGNSALDRLAHSAYQILMDGPSLRKQNSPK